MTWWLYRSTRLSSEKASLADLEGSVDWLHVGQWWANSELAMCLDFQIAHGGEEFSFQMIYPSVFPDAPPMVYTKDRTRISNHQYGADGELCLEHRPDNWHPSITGADMVASCHRLIAEERPEAGEIVHAHSAHVASLGRDLRTKFCRFLMTEADLEAVNTLAEYTSETLALRDRRAASTFISSINYIGTEDVPVWTSDLMMPKGGTDDAGYVVRAPGLGKLGNIKPEDLRTLLNRVKLRELAETLFDSGASLHLLLGDGEHWELFWIYGDEKDRKLITYTTVQVPNDRQRLPNDIDILAEKKVGIVGCGSIGSKIAASLCRTGVGSFLLIDDDIFLPGNIVRNELDLNEIGAHKSHALQERLLKINPCVDIKVLRIAIGGQESAKSMATALEGSYLRGQATLKEN